jgi:hypothetical protein
MKLSEKARTWLSWNWKWLVCLSMMLAIGCRPSGPKPPEKRYCVFAEGQMIEVGEGRILNGPWNRYGNLELVDGAGKHVWVLGGVVVEGPCDKPGNVASN